MMDIQFLREMRIAPPDQTFLKHCDKCHPDMYAYHHLPENIKEYDRVTVRAVLDAIEALR